MIYVVLLPEYNLSLDNNLLQSFNLSDTLYSLTALSISGNKIKNYSGLLKAPNIIKLNLSDNKMVAVPLEVGNSKNLLDLDLSHNKITNYDKLAYLKKLRTLSLSNNFLEKIPTSLSSVNTIAKLDISFNKELNIDSTLNQLIAYFGVLEELNVSYCELSHIPSIISELKHLKRIIISGNKLSKQAIDELQRNIPICDPYQKRIRAKVQCNRVAHYPGLDRASAITWRCRNSRCKQFWRLFKAV